MKKEKGAAYPSLEFHEMIREIYAEKHRRKDDRYMRLIRKMVIGTE